MPDHRILLVENDADEANLTLRALRKARVTGDVVVTHDATEAGEHLFGRGAEDRILPQMVLLDLDPGETGGIHLLRRIRAEERTRDLRVVGLTSSDEEWDRYARSGLGVTGFVRKPVGSAAVRRVAEEAGIDRASAEGAAQAESPASRVVELIRRAVRPGWVCLDVGPGRGFFAREMARAGAASVHLFEGDDRRADRLERMVREDRLLRMRLHRIALASQPAAPTPFAIAGGGRGGWGGRLSRAPELVSGPVGSEVQSLDHLVRTERLPLPDLVRVDLPGGVEEVLMGAEETIEQWGPIWFLRIRRAGRSERCARLLEERGYEVTHLGTETSPGWSGTHRASHLVATPLC